MLFKILTERNVNAKRKTKVVAAILIGIGILTMLIIVAVIFGGNLFYILFLKTSDTTIDYCLVIVDQ